MIFSGEFLKNLYKAPKKPVYMYPMDFLIDFDIVDTVAKLLNYFGKHPHLKTATKVHFFTCSIVLALTGMSVT